MRRGVAIGEGGRSRHLPTGEAWIPDTLRLASLDAAFRDDEAEGGGASGGALHLPASPWRLPAWPSRRPFPFVIPGEAGAKRRRRPGIHASAGVEGRDDAERRRRPGGFGALTLAGSAETWIPDTRRLAPLDAAFRDDEAEGTATALIPRPSVRGSTAEGPDTPVAPSVDHRFGNPTAKGRASPLPSPHFHPTLSSVSNQLKGGDPMSSGFVFQSVAPADCLSGKQPS